MTDLFSTILHMSLTASYVALVVIIIRIFMKKVPKIFSYMLWVPVLIRLVLPFSFNSSFSFFRFIKQPPQSSKAIIGYALDKVNFMQNPSVNAGINVLNNAGNTTLPSSTPITNANPLQIALEISSYIWVVGIAVLLIYSIVSYIKVINNVKTATLVKDNVFETDRITTPFVCGFIKPRIFIPAGMDENELSYILEHEQTHIKRLDYIIKPFAFLVLIFHWFNPLMWLSFALMSKDMEMSCDESVVKKVGNDIKASYSNSLLSLSVKSSGLIMGSPLAFGERNIKSRIKNILSYKKPAFWVIALAIVITAVLIVGFTANPKIEQAAAQTTYLGYDIETLIANKTPYVGNNSKVVALIDAMPLPEGVVRDTVELHTEKKPYGITINLIMKDSSNVKVNGAISGIPFYPNSIVLFSLIDNVDLIEYKISDKTGDYDGALYTQAHDRQSTVELMQEDVRNYGDSTQTLKNLINKLNIISFAPQQTTKTSGSLESLQTLKTDQNIVTDESLSPQEWDSQVSINKSKSLQNTAKKFIERKGYKIVVNSGVAMEIILPKDFTVKSGEVEIGKFFYEKNEQSKKNGFDFSKELGKRIYLFGYEISKDDVRQGFIFILFNNDNLIGSWIDQSKEESDLKIITRNLEIILNQN